jgi:hypothetical protein
VSIPDFLHSFLNSLRLCVSAVDPALSIVIRKLEIVNFWAAEQGKTLLYNNIQSFDFLANADSPAPAGTLVPPNQILLSTA